MLQPSLALNPDYEECSAFTDPVEPVQEVNIVRSDLGDIDDGWDGTG